MAELLYISASPREEASAARSGAKIFLDALANGTRVQVLDLFEMALPEVTREVTSAKMKFAMGADLDQEEARQWQVITDLVDAFKAADHYLFAVPMWNFSIPYRLKQYIDLITHPGLTFTRDADGIRGLANGPATVVYARGGDYSPQDDGSPDPYDFQSPYLKAWLGLVGLDPVEEVLIQNTMAGPERVEQALEAERARLAALAGTVGRSD